MYDDNFMAEKKKFEDSDPNRSSGVLQKEFNVAPVKRVDFSILEWDFIFKGPSSIKFV